MKNLNYVLQNFKLSMGIVSSDHDQQFLQWIINGLRQMNEWEMIKEALKGVELPIVNQEANLPADYQDYVRIGVCVRGTFINFDMNDDICMTSAACPCDEAQISATVEQCCNGNWNGENWLYPAIGQPYSYSYTTGSYAQGPGFYHGGYKIDHARKIIRFDKCVKPTSMRLEYIGDFMNDMGNAIIPDSFVRPLVLYADHERKYWSPDERKQRQAPAAQNKWYQSIRDLNAKQQKMNKAEWEQLIRRYTYMGVKA